MKIQQNSIVQNTDFNKSESDQSKVSGSTTASAQESAAVITAQQKLGIEAKASSNFSAAITQTMLATAIPSKSEPLMNTAKELSPKVPLMIAQSQNADAFKTAVTQQVQGTSYANLGNLNGQDIESLCFITLMQASKSAQEDLKAIMDGVKDINQQKQAWRETFDELKDYQSGIGHKPDDDD